MHVIKEHTTTTLEVKQSKFIAHLIPYHQFLLLLETLKAEHPKARHFVTAYRYLNEYDQIVEHSSDDGEPKGTAGKPSLMVLQGKDIINSAVIIVRYFGGTKLGTGGLVRAYSDALNLVIQEADLLEYRAEATKIIELEYGDVRLVDYEIDAHNVLVVNKKFDSKVLYTIKGTQKDLENLLAKLARIIRAR